MFTEPVSGLKKTVNNLFFITVAGAALAFHQLPVVFRFQINALKFLVLVETLSA
tara:strand:+ start:227 stop:388 length:162 start_codon:yes stop_codon:yes gene_type:complete